VSKWKGSVKLIVGLALAAAKRLDVRWGDGGQSDALDAGTV